MLKSGGRRERFDRYKIEQGVKLACNKRPIGTDKIKAIVDEIEAEVSSRSKSEIEAEEIGEMVMERLRPIDDIAYVRFASVYRKFQDKEEFLKEIKKLLE